MKRFAFIAIVLFVCTLISVAEENGRIVLTIDVINGTTNGKSVSEDEVLVNIFEHEKLINTLHGKIGDDGKAVFKGIPSREHLVAYPQVKHQGMSFNGHAVALKPEQQHANALVQVFDVSYENSSLSVVTHHLKIRQEGNCLVLSEFILLRNSSDFAITSKEKDSRDKAIVLTIPLPKGFKDFTSSGYLVPEALVFTEEGFYDTMAVPPGDYQLIFSYNLEIRSPDMDIVKKISLPTSSLVVFSQLGLVVLDGLGESDGKVVLPDDIAAEYYDQGSMPAGAQIAFKVVGLSFNKGNRNSWIVAASVFGVLTILSLTRLLPAKNYEQTIAKQ
ncbi:MAG: hypothetical protein ACYSYU_00755 [Planctomycetota bacterium]